MRMCVRARVLAVARGVVPGCSISKGPLWAEDQALQIEKWWHKLVLIVFLWACWSDAIISNAPAAIFEVSMQELQVGFTPIVTKKWLNYVWMCPYIDEFNQIRTFNYTIWYKKPVVMFIRAVRADGSSLPHCKLINMSHTHMWPHRLNPLYLFVAMTCYQQAVFRRTPYILYTNRPLRTPTHSLSLRHTRGHTISAGPALWWWIMAYFFESGSSSRSLLHPAPSAL